MKKLNIFQMSSLSMMSQLPIIHMLWSPSASVYVHRLSQLQELQKKIWTFQDIELKQEWVDMKFLSLDELVLI